MKRSAVLTTLILLVAALAASSSKAQPVEAVTMTPSDLVKLDPEEVPEKVHLTEVKSGYSGYDLVLPVDIEAYILETIPKNWVY